jgi:hypothetical protein
MPAVDEAALLSASVPTKCCCYYWSTSASTRSARFSQMNEYAHDTRHLMHWAVPACARNLILTIDQVTLNSWNRLLVTHI